MLVPLMLILMQILVWTKFEFLFIRCCLAGKETAQDKGMPANAYKKAVKVVGKALFWSAHTHKICQGLDFLSSKFGP